MKRTAFFLLAGVVLTLAGSGNARTSGQIPAGQGLDLIALFGPRGLARDGNGDGIADTVAARLVLPDSPTLEDSTAAANLAARLGFETSALSLPLTVKESAVAQASGLDIPIVIGRGAAAVKTLNDRGAIKLSDLTPGQGLIAAVRAPLGGGDGLVIVGGDDKGTLAAANVVAGRLPRLWSMSGVTLSGVAEQVTRYLARSGVDARASITSIVVDSDRRGLAAVTVRAAVASAAASKAQKTLEDLDRLHRRGLEPQMLNFSEIAKTNVELWADGRLAASAAVMRGGLNGRSLTPPIDPNELATDSPGDRGRPADAPAGAQAGRSFDLSNPYSISGWYGDGYADLIPDRTDTSLILGGGADVAGAAHIAARLGLETTGVTMPIARMDSEVSDPTREQNPILVGRNNRLVQDLVKIGRANFSDVRAGEGVVQIVPRAFGNLTATVVAGADPAGTEAASVYLARRVPYVWDNRRGAFSYSDLKTDVTRFLGGKSAAGQASQALSEIDNLLADIATHDTGHAGVQSFDAKLYLETPEPGLDAFLTSRISSALKNAKVTVASEAMTAPTPVIDETFEIPWEVDDFRARLRAEVLPKITAGASVDLEARLSESPEYRKALAEEIRAELVKAGASNPSVRILSAYKQGYLWLTERVIPELKGKGARGIHIKVAEYKPDFSKKYKFYQVPSRWLHELYPVDDIVLRELGIAKDQFSLELVDAAKDIYTVEALDAAGRVIHTATFNPKFVEREYLDKFPGWSRVDVTTGWITASVNGKPAIDARIPTDPERFWDQYQSKVLPRIYDYVMKVTDNRPMPDKQPFHRDLDVDVQMSEPDFRIGVDEEIVSSLESLHEDLYFVTLDFFDALGRTTTRRRLAAPGKIFPIIHPERRGKPGTVHVLYAGNRSPRPQLEIRYAEGGGKKPETVRRELGKIDTTPPQALRAVVRSDAISEIELQVDAKDDREAARAADALDAIGRLHAANLFKTALSYDHVDRVSLAIAQRDTRTRRVVGSTGAFAPSNVRTAAAKPKSPVVTWDHVISPDESEEIVGKLAAYPEIKAYKAGVWSAGATCR